MKYTENIFSQEKKTVSLSVGGAPGPERGDGVSESLLWTRVANDNLRETKQWTVAKPLGPLMTPLLLSDTHLISLLLSSTTPSSLLYSGPMDVSLPT